MPGPPSAPPSSGGDHTLRTAVQVDSHTWGRLASSSVLPKEGFSETNQFRSEKLEGARLRSGSLGGAVVRK